MKSVAIKAVIFIGLILTAVTSLAAENYVNWKGGFWFEVPEDWEKIDYRIVDQYLRFTDTSREVFEYEAVFAPESSEVFMQDAYLVITFDSTGQLNAGQVDSVLREIAGTYATHIYDAPIVKMMTDLVPGRPKVDRAKKAVSVLSDMAYRPGAMKKVWQYMQLNDHGLITFFFYSADSTYEQNMPVFQKIVESLSFENLREAVGEELKFTDIGGDKVAAPKAEYSGQAGQGTEEKSRPSGGSAGRYFLYGGIIVIILVLILRLFRRKS